MISYFGAGHLGLTGLACSKKEASAHDSNTGCPHMQDIGTPWLSAVAHLSLVSKALVVQKKSLPRFPIAMAPSRRGSDVIIWHSLHGFRHSSEPVDRRFSHPAVLASFQLV